MTYSCFSGARALDSALSALFEAGEWRQLTVALDETELDQKNDPELWFLLGKAHRELGQAELGFDAFAKALQLDPVTPLLRLEAVEALLSCNEWALARQLLQQPAGGTAAQLPLGRWALARCASRLGEPNQAESQLLGLQADGGLDLERLGVGLSECNLMLGDLDRARFCLDIGDARATRADHESHPLVGHVDHRVQPGDVARRRRRRRHRRKRVDGGGQAVGEMRRDDGDVEDDAARRARGRGGWRRRGVARDAVRRGGQRVFGDAGGRRDEYGRQVLVDLAARMIGGLAGRR